MPAFHNNVVILTGASRGIGEQLAYQLADAGARLVLAARDELLLERVAEECRRRGGEALVVPTDCTSEEQCHRLVERAAERYGRVDTLLYNAGRGWPHRFADMPDLRALEDEIRLNYLGLVYCLYYALPHLRRARGRVVAVESFGGFVGIPGTSGYNASKHALRGFLNTVRAELRGTGVTVSLAYAGAVRTDRLVETMGANVEKVRAMSPERCAEIILDAAARRKRQVIMTAEGKLLVLLYQIAPGLVDRLLTPIGAYYTGTTE